ncbi:MAG: hypothetical protein ACFE8B_05090, partial [Candidatus Hermodarchaeota archaeon]
LKEEQKKVSLFRISFQRVSNLGISRILMLIAVIISILSILLSFTSPELAAWYQYTVDTPAIPMLNYYLTGLGTYICKGTTLCTNDIAFIGLIGGILVLVGSAVSLVAIIRNSKIFTIIGGIIIFLGPLLLIIEILTGIDYFNELLSKFSLLQSDARVNSFYGSNRNLSNILRTDFSWGLGNGFYIAIVGGTLGLISSISTIILKIKMKGKVINF